MRPTLFVVRCSSALRRTASGPAAALVALFASACGPLGGTMGTAGELGNGVFSYSCVGESDPTCDTQAPSALLPMPKGIAVGSRFAVTYSPTAVSTDKGSATVEPVSKDLIGDAAGLGSQFQALKPDIAGLLAMRGTEVIDVVHVELAPADHLRFEQLASEFDTTPSQITNLSMLPGETVTIRAVPVNPVGETLAGALDCSWSSSSDTIAAIATSPNDDRIDVQGVGVGAAMLTVKLGTATGTLAVSVGDTSGTSGGTGGGTGGALGGGGAGGAL